MIARVLRHEWRLLTADYALTVVLAAFGLTLAAGLASGLRWRSFLDTSIAQATTEEHERYRALRNQADAYDTAVDPDSRGRDPRIAATLAGRAGSKQAVLPVQPLAVLSVGQSDLLPSAVRVSNEAREQILSAAEIENPHRLLEGRFDVTFVLVYLFPLLILALSYNLLAGEREDGTLMLVLSQPVSLPRLIAAKLAFRLLLFIGVVVVIAGITLLFARISPIASGIPARLLLWTFVVVLYGGFWFAVALYVGSRGWSSATTALQAAGVWLAAVAVVPAGVNLAVNAWYPMPSRVQMVQAMRDASAEATTRGSVLLAKYMEDHPELTPADDRDRAAADSAVTRVAVAVEAERLVRPVVERYESQIANQRRAAAWLRYTSPALIAREVLDDIAGTSGARHAAFVRQVDGFHAEWRSFFTPLVAARSRVPSIDAVPSFRYVDEPFSAVLHRAVPGLAVILAASVLLAFAGAHRLARYPPTR
jgi:ABC-2 type transport system permease protein